MHEQCPTKQDDQPIFYKIIHDGTRYGISLRGRVFLHDMEWWRARKISELLNRIQALQLVCFETYRIPYAVLSESETYRKTIMRL